MKAWEIEREIIKSAIPVVLSEDEQTWLDANNIEKNIDDGIKMIWKSNVPGSFAPESIMTAAVQAKENMGYIVKDGVLLIKQGLEAFESNNMTDLHRVTSILWHNINNAEKDDNHSYWKFKEYSSFKEYIKDIEVLKKEEITYSNEILLEKTYSGWLAQIIGGALGTALEGYTTKNIEKVFGDINNYVRKPNTFNDDITFEIAFLEAFKEKSYDITSNDIALSWISLVPMGWSAEDIAIRNIRYGIMPPDSALTGNPFVNWIGAQMRGAICGQLAPGDPVEAARLAWIDGSVSHYSNGIIGEVFNACLVSLSYTNTDIRKILQKTMSMISKKSEFYDIANFAYSNCIKNNDWKEVWSICEERFEKYNWIHSYPNIMAQIVALYFGNGDFDKTLNIIAMCGQDVDCNAAQIMTAIGIIIESKNIDSRWKKPLGDRLQTYLRKHKELSIRQLSIETFNNISNKYKNNIDYEINP